MCIRRRRSSWSWRGEQVWSPRSPGRIRRRWCGPRWMASTARGAGPSWELLSTTPESGRYEFRSDLLKQQSPGHGSLPAGIEISVRPLSGGERATVASFALLLFEPLPIAGGTGAELPFLQGILDPGHAEGWETWVEIHPESAAPLGVKDGAWVRVQSREGAITARARVTPRVVPGVAAIPVGLGKKGGGRWAKRPGGNPLAVSSRC